MKKIIICIISVMLLVGCNTNINKSNEKLNIVTTIFPQYDFVREIGKDKVNVKMLLKPGEEAHSYEPTPKDIKMIMNSDLFICVGGENDSWVENILDSLDHKPDTLKLIDCVDTVNEKEVEGMQEEKGEEDEEEIDEHVWTSPIKAIDIVEKINSILITKDNLNKDYYNNNTKAYIKELRKIDNQFKEVVNNSIRKTIVFGDRYPFRYLSDEYGLTYYAAFSGCSSDNEVSAKTLAFLINKVKEENIPVVFSIELSNKKISEAICEETGARTLVMNSYHNITSKQLEDGTSYLKLARLNIKNLSIALN